MAPTPTLDTRNAAAVVAELVRALPAYVPELRGTTGGPGWAMLQLLGRYMQILIERLNHAPDKNKLAFLELMGINLLPAQAARAAVVFEPMPNLADGHIPARTRVGAKVPDRDDPLVFETERAIALANAKLTEVIALWPARDSYADHSDAAIDRRPFTLFAPLKPIRHEVYLSHDTHLALNGSSTVSIEFDLSSPGGKSLAISWEFWNGQVWQPFVIADSTLGLKRSGVVRLSNDCGPARRKTVNGIEAYWIRGILTEPMPPEVGAALATVNQIRLSSTMSRPLVSPCAGDILPEKALSGGGTLDLTRTFFPLGRTPDQNSALYFSSEEVFSKPGATAKLCIKRVKTPEEEADELASEQLSGQALALELKIAGFAGQSAVHSARALSALLQEIANVASDDPALLAVNVSSDALETAVNNLEDEDDMEALPLHISLTLISMAPLSVTPFADEPMGTGGSPYVQTVNDLIGALEALRDLGPLMAAAHADTPFQTAKSALLEIEALGTGLFESIDDFSDIALRAELAVAISALQTAAAGFTDLTGIDALLPAVNDVRDKISNIASADADAEYPPLYTALMGAQAIAQAIVGNMVSLANTAGHGTADTAVPQLDPPRLIWEYWNGVRWKTLLAPANNNARNFLASGTITFTVPTDFDECEIQGQTARWVRVRISTGSYNTLRFVSWQDPVSGTVSQMAILQPRPPALEGFYMGYEYHSPKASAQRCIALNDFVWEDHTTAARWPGSPFEPFHPIADRNPALYFGFDRALPADLVSLYLNIQEKASQTTGPALIWEYWSGSAWNTLSATDETRRLALPGMVSIVWPGPSLRQLARFGTARTWIRARLESEGDPLSSRVLGVHLNAVWASNLQTVENEMLGSSNGQPDQTFFFRQTPVVEGESFEVRELEGARAIVELPMLREELLAQGLSDDDIRVVPDPRTGKTREVWIRWRVLPNLLFSTPGSRDATVERTRGRLILGDGIHGRIPAAGLDNIRANRYRFGGGRAGNVPASAISQLMSGVTAQAVENPRAAEGGANGESSERVLTRGPRVIRHRYRAVSQEDYEDLAREACPGVAFARALPATHPNLRPAPGWVTVILVPQSEDARPQPSFELRRRVHEYLAARAPAAISGIGIIGPTYLPVGVDATVAPRDPELAKSVATGVRAALAKFLHPLTGGPEDLGWPFGRNLYLSDVAAVVEDVAGVDYASQLDLLVDGTPWGDVVDVPGDRILVAGRLRVLLAGAEE